MNKLDVKMYNNAYLFLKYKIKVEPAEPLAGLGLMTVDDIFIKIFNKKFPLNIITLVIGQAVLDSFLHAYYRFTCSYCKNVIEVLEEDPRVSRTKTNLLNNNYMCPHCFNNSNVSNVKTLFCIPQHYLLNAPSYNISDKIPWWKIFKRYRMAQLNEIKT